MTEPIASAANRTNQPVTLDNCADEPIHLPGSIQPHGALLVFNNAVELVSWSANAQQLLALEVAPALQVPFNALGLAPEVGAMVDECLAEMQDGESAAMLVETTVGEKQFDCIIHAHDGVVIVEYECREAPSDMVAMFALKAHSAIERLKRQKSLASLLQAAVDQIRLITGFDRVMGYQFRHDDSGDVVAEARSDALEPYLGRRYPASDIPAQARHLYVSSTLRLISDVGDKAVPMVGRSRAAPLDMTYCVMRSVSPIHIEYLKNMGVQASMSVSIVVAGRLWGLIACHHMQPRRVPYSIRMAADVMAQVLASTVQSIETRERSALIETAAQARTHVMESLLHHDDVLTALAQCAGEIAESLGASALIVMYRGRLHVHGAVAPDIVAAVIASLADETTDTVVRTGRRDWPAEAQQTCGSWVGMLGLRYDEAAQGWLLALREEQVESVRWAGPPDKVIAHGPLGPRLTPRGSFQEWRQTVVGMAEPWEPTRMIIARQLLGEMNRAAVSRHEQNEKARAQLLAMLGHDLRNPLQSISMAAAVLELGGSQEVMGRRIKASSGRMERLIAQVLDMSQINGGMRLGSSLGSVDLVPVLADLADEFRTAIPHLVLNVSMPATLLVTADRDRIAQVLGNLISNANHHGTSGEPIQVTMSDHGDTVSVEVRNLGDEIVAETAKTLYNPFKRLATNNARNKGGMGLGLYIAQQIMLEHGGAVEYRYAAPYVTFSVSLPAAGVGTH